MNIVITILVFFGIIIIHELGHYFTARMFNMNTYEFSVGMGPRLFSIQGKKTLWSFRLLPVGGAVQLGEDLESSHPLDFRNKPVWQRMIVIVAGAVMNLILGFIVCVISVCSSSNIPTTRISVFTNGSVSSEVLQVGDEIIAMEDMPIFTTMDISYCFQNKVASYDETNERAYFNITVLRNGEQVQLKVPFRNYSVSDGSNSAGIAVDFRVFPEEKNFFTVTRAAFGMFMTESRLIWISFRDLLTGTYGINDLSGPIGVVSTMSTAYSTLDISSFLTLVALITINLGIFNLLPIPALDGARFIFLLIEAIRRKPVPAEKEGWVHLIGLAALMLLMLVVTFNDIVKLFG